MVTSVRYAGLALALFTVSGCTPQQIQTEASGGDSTISSTDEALSGCHGTADHSIPSDDQFYLTTFGGYGEGQVMSCGQNTHNGNWYYIASRQRFGCGAKVRLTTATKCVVAEADDYGPDVCVERAAGKAIIDASPKVAKALFGVSAAGWSEHRAVKAEVVADSTPLGPCTLSGSSPAPSDPTDPVTPDPAQEPTDPNGTCASYTLGRDVPVTQCVESKADNRWYQCTSIGWVRLASDGTGLLGACTERFPLSN